MMNRQRVKHAAVRRHARFGAVCAAALAGVLTPVLSYAGPTLEDISKSFDSKLSQKPDSGNVTAIVIGIIAVICILAIASQWGRRQETPKVLNHSGRLLREIRRKIHLSGAQVKRLKVLSERKGCDSPLTLLLCPSLLSRSSARSDERAAAAEDSPKS